MSEWVDNNCEHCGANNFICLGDSSDETAPDVDGFKCHACQNVQLFDLDGFIEEHAFIEDGVESPQ